MHGCVVEKNIVVFYSLFPFPVER